MSKLKKTPSKHSPHSRPITGLGRGLTDIIQEGGRSAGGPPPSSVVASGVRLVELTHIAPNPRQPRSHFVDEPLDELAASIREKGVLSPITVRPMPGENGRFEIIAGERRFRACKKLGISSIPVIVKVVSDGEAYELSLIENLQRENLNPMEEARGYQRLLKDFALTQEQIAKKVSRNRVTIANAVRLLELPEEIQGYLSQGLLSTGHAKAILALPEEAQRVRLARDVLKQGLNVRQTEQTAARLRSGGSARRDMRSANVDRKILPTHFSAIQDALQQKLAMKVQIHPDGNGGRIEVTYYTPSDLDRVLEILQIRL